MCEILRCVPRGTSKGLRRSPGSYWREPLPLVRRRKEPSIHPSLCERDLAYSSSVQVRDHIYLLPISDGGSYNIISSSIGSPHYTTADVIYKDYFIPAGTVVSINQYALHFDPKRWEDPDDFIPDRYLDYPLKAGVYVANPDPDQQIHFDFGAGRRICPGMHLAENSLFITIACIIWAFEILPPIENGKVGQVDVSDAAYADGVTTLPKQSKLRFVPRNSTVAQTIRTEWPVAKEKGYMLGNVKVDAKGIVPCSK